MYEIIQKMHSGWAYIAILLLVVVVANAAAGYFGKKEFKNVNRQIALFGLIGAHIQLIIGMIIYFISPIGFSSFKSNGVSEVMKDASIRLTAVEHPLINIIAILLITIGWSKHKAAVTSEGKFKSIFIFYTIGALLILSRIPWSKWL